MEAVVNIQPLDLLVHFGNVLLLVSYSVRSMLWLRWFAVASALTVVPYYVAQETVLWPPVFWAMVFTAINLYQIARLYAERRPVRFSADEQKLYDLAFQALRPRQFLSLVMIGQWKDGSPGVELLKEGERAATVCVAISGAIEVRRQGQKLATLRSGQAIGTALALTDTPSQVSASFTEAGRYIQWPVSQLRVFSDRNPDLRVILQGLVNQDLARKLEAAVSLAPATN
jgi:Popeye protein conserved region